MGYLTLRERPRQFLALTSLLPVEFDELLTDFAPAWERYHRYHTLDGAKRRLPAHAERANATLSGSDTKLFFLLTYLKSNSLQQHQAASFGVSQTRVSRLATALLGVLNQVLHRRGLLPVRDGAELARHLTSTRTRSLPTTGSSAGCRATPTAKHRPKNTAEKKSASPEKNDLKRRYAVQVFPLPYGRRAGA